MHTSFMVRLRAAGAAALVALGACGTALGNPGNPTPVPLSIADVYAHALAAAAVYEDRYVVPLFPAIADTQGLVFVTTLTTWNPDTVTQTLTEDVWVSVVPEVRDSCLSWNDETDVVMRLRQLLGLRPTDSVTQFVEMTAPASGMFRPAVDPAIDTRTPCSPEQALLPGCGRTFPAGVDTAHVVWMANQAFSSWKMPNDYPRQEGEPSRLGYPWTALGYTYNWHPGSPRYGASEYLVRSGTQVTVTGVIPIARYCGRST
jgi:hypothetical protein